MMNQVVPFVDFLIRASPRRIGLMRLEWIFLPEIAIFPAQQPCRTVAVAVRLALKGGGSLADYLAVPDRYIPFAVIRRPRRRAKTCAQHIPCPRRCIACSLRWGHVFGSASDECARLHVVPSEYTAYRTLKPRNRVASPSSPMGGSVPPTPTT